MFKEELIIIRHARSKHNVYASDDVDDGITKFGELFHDFESNNWFKRI